MRFAIMGQEQNWTNDLEAWLRASLTKKRARVRAVGVLAEMGVGMLGATIARELKIPVWLFVPWPGYAATWPGQWAGLYQRVKASAQCVTYSATAEAAEASGGADPELKSRADLFDWTVGTHDSGVLLRAVTSREPDLITKHALKCGLEVRPYLTSP